MRVSDGDSPVSLASVPRQIRSATRERRIFRKCLGVWGTISTNATGFINLISISSASVTTSSQWAASATLALEYRVVAFDVIVTPVVNMVTSFTSPPPNGLATCAFSSGTAPATITAVTEGPESKVVQLCNGFTLSASARGFNDGLLWTAIGGSIPTSNTYGVIIADGDNTTWGPAGPISQVVARYVQRFIVEFRSLD